MFEFLKMFFLVIFVVSAVLLLILTIVLLILFICSFIRDIRELLKIAKEEKKQKEKNKIPELKDLTREELALICRALSDSMNYHPDYCKVEKWNLLLKCKTAQIEKEDSEQKERIK